MDIETELHAAKQRYNRCMSLPKGNPKIADAAIQYIKLLEKKQAKAEAISEQAQEYAHSRSETLEKAREFCRGIDSKQLSQRRFSVLKNILGL